MFLSLPLSYTRSMDNSIYRYPVTPVSFTDVQLSDDFWSPRIRTHIDVTIPQNFKMMEETGRIANFEVAAGSKEGESDTLTPCWSDSDVYKVIEGSSYSLMIDPDAELEAYLDRLIEKIASAQEDDGYIYTARTICDRNGTPPPNDWVGNQRWQQLDMSHELYDVGHMYEAAAAHFKATGRRNFLDVAVKNADYLLAVFGPDKLRAVPGHQEIEIGLTKLYAVTGKQQYLDLCKFFLNERGRHEHSWGNTYNQNHKPLFEQETAVGHTVRALYMYIGLMDAAVLSGDGQYITKTLALMHKLWKDIVFKKMYVHGGVGQGGNAESFEKSYFFPEFTDDVDLCSPIALFFLLHRIYLHNPDAAFIDIMERILYNRILEGVSLDGKDFTYGTPMLMLRSRRPVDRPHRFFPGCCCCPTSFARFLHTVPGYIYAHQNDTIYVNLFIGGSCTIETASNSIVLTQSTGYPWKGEVRIAVDPEQNADFELCIRIPGWAQNQAVPGDLYRFSSANPEEIALQLNGEQIEPDIQKGYVRIRRAWNRGDMVILRLPMPVRRVISDEKVKDNMGRIALQRGPIIFCLEGEDNGGSRIFDLVLPHGAGLSAAHRPDLLDGVAVISGTAHTRDEHPVPVDFTAIPYYSWDNRKDGDMLIWIPGKA